MIQDTVRDNFDRVRDIGTDDILSALGLQRRPSAVGMILPAIGVFAAGLALGAGAALLLAPKSGQAMRRDLQGKASELGQRIGSSAEGLVEGVRENLLQVEDAHKTVENGRKHEPPRASSSTKTA